MGPTSQIGMFDQSSKLFCPAVFVQPSIIVEAEQLLHSNALLDLTIHDPKPYSVLCHPEMVSAAINRWSSERSEERTGECQFANFCSSLI